MLQGREPWFRHYLGAIGELAYSRYSGLPLDRTTIGRGDSGQDFSDGTQVKASDKPNPNLMLGQGDWKRKPAKRYVLVEVRVEKKEAVLIGWITREEADAVKVSKDFGYGPVWMIQRGYLHPIVQKGAQPA